MSKQTVKRSEKIETESDSWTVQARDPQNGLLIAWVNPDSPEFQIWTDGSPGDETVRLTTAGLRELADAIDKMRKQERP